MLLASRETDRITYDKAGLAGTWTKKRCLPEGQTTEKRDHAHTKSTQESPAQKSFEVNGCRSGLVV